MPSFRDTPVDREAILEQIRCITAIESPTSHPVGVNRVLDVIASWFDGTGARPERAKIDDRFGDVLRVRSDPASDVPGILVLSHVDTVHPVGTLGSTLPFRIEGDKAFGPGIYDMKGGLVLAIAAFQRLAKAGSRGALPITFMFTPDEEVGSIASRPHIEAEARRSRYVLVTEPKHGGTVVTSRKGTGRFLIEAYGRPSHSGAAHAEGRSAIRAMAKVILQVEGFTDYERGITTNVGLVSGGTGVNVVPEYCRINADMRVCDESAARETEARFLALKSPDPGVELKVSGGVTRPPFERGAHVDLLFDKAAAVARELGVRLETGPRNGGGSDGNFTAAMGLPTLDGLGVDGDGAHTHEEHMLISSIEPGTRLMQGLFERLR
ncbi:MAG TPA: M20 family metallopeptidase [Hyphomicrobiaceae bacterium]|nr:M20 family metallopeptidase [Hyphomicrobiaceae bacterium]